MTKHTLMYNQDYVIREENEQIRLGSKIRGMTLVDEEGRANVYMSHIAVMQTDQRSLKHELNHQVDGDHYRCREAAEQDMDERIARRIYELDHDDYIVIYDPGEEKKSGESSVRPRGLCHLNGGD